MGEDPADALKDDGPPPDIPEVPKVLRRSSKILVAMAILTVIGATVAGANAIGVHIDDPVAFERSGEVVTQVLPITPTAPPTTAPPTTAPPTTAPPTTTPPTTTPGTVVTPAGDSGSGGSTTTMSASALTALLRSGAPGVTHEATPHGVPIYYSWATRATTSGNRPPTTSSRFVNLWGQIYAGQSNVRPANTRVAVDDCELWLLPATGDWRRVQGGPNSRLEGGAWTEDFTRDGGTFDIRNEGDGSQSMVTTNGYNAHYWTRDGLVDSGSGARGFFVACSARLVLANPNGVDDRAQSSYVMDVGADWRESNYACPTVNGITVCDSIGLGRFVRITNSWRRVFMTSTDLTAGGLPALPVEAMRNPDGTFGG